MTGIRYIALSALFSACFFLSVSAGKAETFVYAVKGTDTLRADLYRAPLLHSALHSENGDSIPGFRSEGAPCMLFMFGGGFYTGERDAAKYSGFFEFLNSLGYSVVSIDYRLGLAPLVSATEKPTLGGLIKLLSQSVDMAV